MNEPELLKKLNIKYCVNCNKSGIWLFKYSEDSDEYLCSANCFVEYEEKSRNQHD